MTQAIQQINNPLANHLPPQKGVPTRCAHCQNPLTDVECFADEGGRLFCCNGCRVVYSAIAACDLHQYYKIRDQYLKQGQRMTSSDRSYEYLTLPSIQAEFLTEAGTMAFYISGIQCAACLWILEKIPEFARGVQSVRADVTKKIVEVSAHSPEGFRQFAEQALLFGYQSEPIQLNKSHVGFATRERRHDLKKIAITAFCAGNIMLLASGNYLGAEADFQRYFNYLSFILILPVMFYTGWGLFRGAWTAVRTRTPSFDLPIVIAVGGGFILSLVNLLTGHPDVYFDSISVLIFLILGSRFFVARIQEKYLEHELSAQALLPLYAVLKEKNKMISALDLKTADLIVVATGQKIPADGLVVQSSGSISEAILTGEAHPRMVFAGHEVYAGTRVEEGPLFIEVTKPQSKSRMAELQYKSLQSAMLKTHTQKDIEAWVHFFTWSIFAVGLGTITYFIWINDWQTGIQRALSLFIVACPCAIAFGVPLVYTRAMHQAAHLGLIVRSGDLFRQLAQIKKFVFDKTGTLTEGRLRLLHSIPPLSREQQRDIVRIESQVNHPVARAIVKEWGQPLTSVTPLEENKCEVIQLPGIGVTGRIRGHNYELRKSQGPAPTDSPETMFVYVKVMCDNSYLSTLTFSDVIKENSAQVIHKLQERGYEVSILSGDRAENVERICRQFGLAPESSRGDCSPEDKEQEISRQPLVAMIGDGVNDAAAIARARVGIIVGGALERALHVGDLFMTQESLCPIVDLLDVQKSALSSIGRIRMFSLLYNLTTATLAVSGYVNPLVAALLMPVSSLSVLALAHFGVCAPRIHFKTSAKAPL